MKAARYNHLLFIRLILLLSCLSFLTSCAIYALSMTTFHVFGEVVEQESGEPIKDVQVLFQDTGFRKYKKDAEIYEKIARTDENGHFEHSFSYSWCTKRAFYLPAPKETFSLILDSPRYERKILAFESRKLIREDRVIQVTVGRVELLPKKQ